MRFNPQETTGSLVRLHYAVDLEYDVLGAAEFVLNVHAAQTDQQTVTGMPRVTFSAVDDPANGFLLPVDTELAVSTAK